MNVSELSWIIYKKYKLDIKNITELPLSIIQHLMLQVFLFETEKFQTVQVWAWLSKFHLNVIYTAKFLSLPRNLKIVNTLRIAKKT